MELKYEFLYNQNAKNSLDKLFSTDFDGKTAYNIRKIHHICNKNFKILQKEFQNTVKKYAKLDEKGFLIEPDGPGSFELKPETAKDFQKEMTDLMKTTFQLDKCQKLHISQIINADNVKLSSFDLESLSPLIDGLDFEMT